MRTLADLSRAERDLLVTLRRRIAADFPGPAFQITLFGSRARGDAEPDADMDVLVEIDQDRLDAADRRRLRRIANEISLDSGIVLSLLLVDRDLKDERGDYSIFENIRDEGIAV